MVVPAAYKRGFVPGSKAGLKTVNHEGTRLHEGSPLSESGLCHGSELQSWREDANMKALLCWTLAAVAALSGVSRAQSAEKKDAGPGSARESSAREKLIGAWRLAWMEEPAADGKLTRITDRKGMLIYTRDGHMSVQLMFPKSESALSNDYVKEGYEASFGSYDVNEEAHTVTHHPEGSITPVLVGKDLPRLFQFSEGHLIIKSTRPDEHWSVAWEHY